MATNNALPSTAAPALERDQILAQIAHSMAVSIEEIIAKLFPVVLQATWKEHLQPSNYQQFTRKLKALTLLPTIDIVNDAASEIRNADPRFRRLKRRDIKKMKRLPFSVREYRVLHSLQEPRHLVQWVFKVMLEEPFPHPRRIRGRSLFPQETAMLETILSSSS